MAYFMGVRSSSNKFHALTRRASRLQHANIPPSQKQHNALPRKHDINLIINREGNIKLKHSDTHTTPYGVREHYWPIVGRNLARHIIPKCIKCFQSKPRGIDYSMRNIPEKHLSYFRPFLNVDVDYCGHFSIK